MLRIKTLTAAVLALGLTAAVPAFAKENNGRAAQDNHRDVRVETRTTRDVRTDRGHDDRTVRVERDVHVNRDVRVDHEIRVERDVRFDHGYRFDQDHDRGFVRIDVAPVWTTPVYVSPNVDEYIALRDVPGCVVDSVVNQRFGPINSVEFVRRDDRTFYRFIVDGRDGRLDVRVGQDGRVLSVEGC